MPKRIIMMIGLICLLISGCTVRTNPSVSLESLPIGYYQGTGYIGNHDQRLLLMNTGYGWLGKIGRYGTIQQLQEQEGTLTYLETKSLLWSCKNKATVTKERCSRKTSS